MHIAGGMARPYAATLLAPALALALLACGTEGTTSTSVLGPTTDTSGSATTPLPPSSPATGTCAAALSGLPSLIPASGGRYSLTLTAPSTCAWTAISQTAYASISPESGQGLQTVTLDVQPNTSATDGRGVTITVNGVDTRITQAAAPCTASVSPTSIGVTKNAETREVALTIPAGCAWTASTNVSWITGLAPTSGTGRATVRFLVEANDKGDPRTGEVVVAGIKVPISQERN